MTNILRIFDFYGTEFHWYFDYKPKYYTSYGGIFSILSFPYNEVKYSGRVQLIFDEL